MFVNFIIVVYQERTWVKCREVFKKFWVVYTILAPLAMVSTIIIALFFAGVKVLLLDEKDIKSDN
jgi:hypothetical protein